MYVKCLVYTRSSINDKHYYYYNFITSRIDPTDPNKDMVVQLIDDFKISGMNGIRILSDDCVAS